jgi:succinate dehydrogenase/fumarate reductase flavoprotein subunit
LEQVLVGPRISEVDLLVVGAGMAGLSAATRELQYGASVIVVEKAPVAGGSASYAGFIWTAPSVEVMREVNSKADPELSSKLAEDYAQAMDWVRSLGIEVKPPVSVLGFGRGCQTDVANLLLTFQRRVREGGELLLEARTERLLIEGGRVCGAEITTQSGEARVIRARATLLATGGFGGDPELRAEHIHPQARNVPLRANRYSTGDGLRLGLSAGALLGQDNAGFYGHVIPSQIPFEDPDEFVALSFYHSEHSVLLNLKGRRFCDETIGDHLTTMALLEQPEARALMIYDRRVHDDWMMQPYVEGAEPCDRFQLAYRRGARCAVSDRLEDFGDLPEEWGYPGPDVLHSLLEYNASCMSDGLHTPPRTLDTEPLTRPPFYVIEVIPAMTFTFQGLLIDRQARVLSAQGKPIPGLLAAGADSGGVFNRAYAGGLANALVFGLQAAATAVGKP